MVAQTTPAMLSLLSLCDVAACVLLASVFLEYAHILIEAMRVPPAWRRDALLRADKTSSS